MVVLDCAVLLLHVVELLQAVPTPSPTPTADPGSTTVVVNPSSGSSGTNLAPYATFAGAVIAAVALLIATAVTRHTAKQTLEQADNVATATADRAHAEALAKRYQDAAGQLGHDKAAVRLAGVYAMARLADDWPAQRQTCVSVLCAYLRMPVKTIRIPGVDENGIDFEDMQVRRAICELISTRVTPVQDDALWAHCDFNLRDAYLPDLNLTDARLDGTITIAGAELVGKCLFVRTRFANGMDARNVIVEGVTRFTDVTFGDKNKAVVLQSAMVRGNSRLAISVDAPPVGEQPQLTLGDNYCLGELSVLVKASAYEPGPLTISGLQLGDSARFKFHRPTNDPDGHVPKVIALRWKTTATAQVIVDKALVKGRRFEGQEWSGDEIPKMSRFYTGSRYVMGTP